MDFTIRPATAEDAAALAGLNAEVQALHAAADPRTYKPADPAAARVVFASWFAEPDFRGLLALAGGAPAGYLLARIVRREENVFSYERRYLYIDQMCVGRAYQRKGCAQALMAAARELSRALGLHALALDVLALNARARRFYEKEGFVATRVMMRLDLGS
jgi:diamine N-acetyltransferase